MVICLKNYSRHSDFELGLRLFVPFNRDFSQLDKTCAVDQSKERSCHRTTGREGKLVSTLQGRSQGSSGSLLVFFLASWKIQRNGKYLLKIC